MNIPDKNILMLSGRWSYIRDADESASYQDIADHLSSGRLPEMNIPTNWELEGLSDYSGTVWFIKSFDWNSDAPGLKCLVFEGVDYYSEVWMNGSFTGRHEGYFQRFHFDVTGTIKRGSNQLIVRVSSPREEPGSVWPDKKRLIKGIFSHHDCRPGAWDMERGQDKNTGGIWNDVFIEYGMDVFIDNIKVRSVLNSDMTRAAVFFDFSYWSAFSNPVSTEISFSVTSPSGKKFEFGVLTEFSKHGSLLVPLEIEEPELWWTWDTGEQNNYRAEISSRLFNTKTVLFAVREVLLDGSRQFFLNRKRLFLRGSNIIPTQWLSDLTPGKIHFQVSLAREAGINILRMHAHVSRHEFYDECDRQGVLIWQDFALQWTYEESPEFTANAVRQIRDMICQRYNHPSIAVWCCHNEPGGQIDTLDKYLFEAASEEDQSRIIRRASNYEEHPYDGWYWGKADHYEAAPMGPLVTEFGAQALPERSSLENMFGTEKLYPPDWQLWEYHNFQFEQTFMIAQIEKGKSIDEFITNSQNYQAYLLKTAIDSYRRRKDNGITGIFQFMFIDCWPSITWSVVDYYGSKKKGYEALKKAYQPVYPLVKMWQEKYRPSDKLKLEIFLINDLHTSFANVKIKISMDGKTIKEYENISLKADSILKYEFKAPGFLLPGEMKYGCHKIIFEVINCSTDEVISVNDSLIEIVPDESR